MSVGARPHQIERDGLILFINWEIDDQFDPKEINEHDNYKGEPAADIAKYLAQDTERREAYDRMEWCMMRCYVEVRLKTPANWVQPHTIGRAALCGIESDCGQTYIETTENELSYQAIEDAKLTLKTALSIPILQESK